jgi:hypothetical protein
MQRQNIKYCILNGKQPLVMPLEKLSTTAFAYLINLHQYERKIGKSRRLGEVGTILGWSAKTTGQIEAELLSRNLIKIANDPGYLQTTAKGQRVYWLFTFQQQISDLHIPQIASHCADLFVTFIGRLVKAIIFTLIFSALLPFLSGLADKIELFDALSGFDPPQYSKWLAVGVSCFLGCIFRNKKLMALDFFLILSYLQYRWATPVWVYTSMFEWFSFYWIDLIGLYYLTLIVISLIEAMGRLKTSDLEKGFLLSDMPLNRHSQQSGKSARTLDSSGLNRDNFASKLAEVIGSGTPFQAVAIGISGRWGSGKTSLLAMIKEHLQTKKDRQYIFVDFSPWFFKNSESLIINFFSELEDKFAWDKALALEIKAYAKALISSENSLLNTNFSEALYGEAEDIKHRYNSITRQINRQKKILVITIDDLDRLDKKEVVDVFRLIRIVADFPKTFYLVAYDRAYICEAIRQELTAHKPEKYIDKIFNLEFKIPDLSSETIVSRLKEAISRVFEQKAHLLGTPDPSEMNRCFLLAQIESVIQTERDIIRFTNNLIVRYMTVRQEVNFYHFFILELISYHDESLHDAIYKNRRTLLN